MQLNNRISWLWMTVSSELREDEVRADEQSHFSFMAGLSFLYAFFNLYSVGGRGVPNLEEAMSDIESCLAVLDYLTRKSNELIYRLKLTTSPRTISPSLSRHDADAVQGHSGTAVKFEASFQRLAGRQSDGHVSSCTHLVFARRPAAEPQRIVPRSFARRHAAIRTISPGQLVRQPHVLA